MNAHLQISINAKERENRVAEISEIRSLVDAALDDAEAGEEVTIIVASNGEKITNG